MRASKEMAERSRQDMAFIAEKCDRLCGRNSGLNADDWKKLQAALTGVSEFLNAAKRKLPTEMAYERDKKRRRAAQ